MDIISMYTWDAVRDKWGVLYWKCRLTKRAFSAEPGKSKLAKMDKANLDNADLEEVMLHKLESIDKDQRLRLQDADDNLGELRRQKEEIIRLQEAVNSRDPNSTADLVARRRNVAELEEIAKVNKTQMRLAAERERFSAKNLFNKRRRLAAMGAILESTTRFVPQIALSAPAADDYSSNHSSRRSSKDQNGDDNDNNNNTNNTSDSHTQNNHGGNNINSGSNSRLKHEGNNQSSAANDDKSKNNKSNRTLTIRPHSAPVPKTKVPGYLRPTASSQGRPMTAAAKGSTEMKYDDVLPARPMQAQRSRSRRQLELLSRVQPEERVIDDDGRTNWKVILEGRRRKQLQKLRQDRELLNGKVHEFIVDMESFNHRPRAAWY